MYFSFWNFISEEDGNTAVEYGLIASLLAVAAIISLQEMGSALSDMFLTAGSAYSVPSAP